MVPVPAALQEARTDRLLRNVERVGHRVNVCYLLSRASDFSLWLYLICKDSGTKEPRRVVCVALRRASPVSSLGSGAVYAYRTDRSASLSSGAILI